VAEQSEPESFATLVLPLARDYGSPQLTAVENVSAVLDKLENRDKSKPLDEDAVWAVLHEVIADLNIKKKSLLTLPLRHALTARKVSDRDVRGKRNGESRAQGPRPLQKNPAASWPVRCAV